MKGEQNQIVSPSPEEMVHWYSAPFSSGELSISALRRSESSCRKTLNSSGLMGWHCSFSSYQDGYCF